MDKAGAVEQHVDAADLGEGGVDRLVVQHIELAGLDPRRLGKFGEKRLVDVGGVDGGSSLGEGQRARLADALRRRRDDNDLACQIRHASFLACLGQLPLSAAGQGVMCQSGSIVRPVSQPVH
ncbi:hypothetical protein ACVINZ_004125 [Mesorhizobium jarvisii]